MRLFVTGEARFHTLLEAEATGVGLILAGHFASERFAVERLAEVLAAKFPGLTVWPSRRERDPLRYRLSVLRVQALPIQSLFPLR